MCAWNTMWKHTIHVVTEAETNMDYEYTRLVLASVVRPPSRHKQADLECQLVHT